MSDRDAFSPPASTEAELAAARAEIGRLGEDLLQAHADTDVERFERKRLEGVLRAVRAWRASRGQKDAKYFAELDAILAESRVPVPVTVGTVVAAETKSTVMVVPPPATSAPPRDPAKRAWCSDCKTVHVGGAHTRPQPLPKAEED